MEGWVHERYDMICSQLWLGFGRDHTVVRCQVGGAHYYWNDFSQLHAFQPILLTVKGIWEKYLLDIWKTKPHSLPYTLSLPPSPPPSNRELEWFGNSLKWPEQKKLALFFLMKLMPSEVSISVQILTLIQYLVPLWIWRFRFFHNIKKMQTFVCSYLGCAAVNLNSIFSYCRQILFSTCLKWL